MIEVKNGYNFRYALKVGFTEFIDKLNIICVQRESLGLTLRFWDIKPKRMKCPLAEILED